MYFDMKILIKQYKKKQFGDVTGFNFGFGILGPPVMTAWCYCVDGILIDTGISRLKSLAVEALVSERPGQILLTHHHEDHSGNAGSISRILGIPVFGHPYAVEKLSQRYSIYPYQHMMWGKSSPVKVLPLEPQIESERTRLIPIHTPGHSLDHTVYFDADQGRIFSGDLFLGEKIKFFRADENIYQQIESLKRILTYDFQAVFCAHRPTLKNGKQCIERKLDFLMNLVGSVMSLQKKGMNRKSIIRTLDRKEDLLVRLMTNGNVSFAHMVTSAIKHINHQE